MQYNGRLKYNYNNLTHTHTHTHTRTYVIPAIHTHTNKPLPSSRYSVPRELGILTVLDSGCNITTETLIQRIVDNRTAYIERNAVREDKEIKYLAGKTFVKEQ